MNKPAVHAAMAQHFADPPPAPDPSVKIEALRTPAAKPPLIQITQYRLRPADAIPRRQWLYGRHYVRQFTSATSAVGGLGKSQLTITEIVAMTSGRPILGVQVPVPLRTWYFNGEDPFDELDRRIAATCQHYGISTADVGDRLFVDSGRDKPLVIAEQTKNGTTIHRPVTDAIIAKARELKLDVIHIDPFVSSHRVSENDNGAVDQVAKEWGRIAQAANCSVHLIHHVKKTGGADATVEDSRGASSLISAVRAARVLNVMSESEAANAGVNNRRLFFRIDHGGKANMAPPADRATWFHFVEVELANGPPGLGDRIGVVTPWQWPDAFAGITPDDLKKVQTAVARARWREHDAAKDWVGRCIADTLGLSLSSRADKQRVKTMLRVWLASGAFVVVEGKDERRETRKFVEVGEWA